VPHAMRHQDGRLMTALFGYISNAFDAVFNTVRDGICTSIGRFGKGDAPAAQFVLVAGEQFGCRQIDQHPQDPYFLEHKVEQNEIEDIHQHGLASDEVLQLKRNLKRKFHKTCVSAIFEPGTLVDQFLDAVLFDGVNIFLARSQ